MSSQLVLPDLDRGFNVAVIGAGGVMGADIVTNLAPLIAARGGDIVGLESFQSALAAGRERFRQSIEGGRKRGKIEIGLAARLIENAETLFTDDLGRILQADLVIEAVPDDLGLKRSVFGDLDSRCKPTSIFATNTSYCPLAQIRKEIRGERRGQFLAMHSFWPAHINKAAEVAALRGTDPRLVEWASELLKLLGKTPLRTAARPGFALNTTLAAVFIAACKAVEGGLGTVAEVDAVSKRVLGIEPFRLANGNKANKIKRAGYPYLAQAISPWFSPPELLIDQADNAWAVSEAGAEVSVDEHKARQISEVLISALFWTVAELHASSVVAVQDLAPILPLAFKMRPLADIANDIGRRRLASMVDTFPTLEFGANLQPALQVDEVLAAI